MEFLTVTGVELGGSIQLDARTVTGLSDRLERSGLVERRSDADDRRVNRLFLTPKGRDLKVPLDREMDEMNAYFVTRLGTRNAQTLWRMLHQIWRIDSTSQAGCADRRRASR